MYIYIYIYIYIHSEIEKCTLIAIKMCAGFAEDFI